MDGALRELAQLQRRAKKAQRRGEKRIAEKIVAEAKSRAPGSIGAGISFTQTEDSTLIFGGTELAAYNEFGTGTAAAAYLAGQPQEVQDEAYKFYINGEGKIPARPFFFPAIFAHQQEIVPAVIEELGGIIDVES